MKPSWTDPERWRELQAGIDCPLCNRNARPGVAAELSSCVVTVDELVGVRGYCCLVLKRHRTELHQLSTEEGADLMRDIRHAARAVHSVTGAVKLNYEIHGNVIPHVHVHLVPRYPGDAMETTGLPFHATGVTAYEPGEFARYVMSLKAALAEI